MGKLLEKSGNFGFNAQTEEYCDMVAAGIIDPTMVVRVALQDAASVASLLIITEATIAEKPKNAPAGGMPGGGMGGGGMAAWISKENSLTPPQTLLGRGRGGCQTQTQMKNPGCKPGVFVVGLRSSGESS